MFGWDIDDERENAVGTPSSRRTAAIHWRWTTEATYTDIASALGVTEQTIRNYLNDGPSDAVKEQMDNLEAEVRMVAVAELREQLQAAGQRSRSAEKPVEVWTDDRGNLQVNDKVNEETGELTGRYPVPAGMELGVDAEARYYARAEVRDILDQLVDLVGAAEPDKVEHSGAVEVESDVVTWEVDKQ